MKTRRVCLAVDLGAGSGRVVAGILENDRLDLRNIHRFTNEPEKLEDGWHWQFDRLFAEIQTGIREAISLYGADVESIGVDTWGVDYGLLDAKGTLLGSPFQYRDSRTDGMMDVAFERMPRAEIYERTGIQFMYFNTLFQLLAEARDPAKRFESAEGMLFLPDLINFRLTGRAATERSIASTGQLLNAKTQDWDRDLIAAMELPAQIFGDLVDAGTDLGPLLPEIAESPGDSPIRVIVSGGHDTASAVAGVPAEESQPVFLSSGTWSLFGRELAEPVLTEAGYEEGFSNESGVFGTIRYLKNISGLWLLQECKRHWDAEGQALDFGALVEAAEAAPAFAAVLDPDAPIFQAPVHMPTSIADWLRGTGQTPLTDPGSVTRTILEGLALRYRLAKEKLETLTDKPITHIHVVGGGSQNRLLNQFAADATGCTVIAGPVEATSAGNILVQLKSLGVISSLAEGRALVRRSFETEIFEPREADAWAEAARKFHNLVGG
jgi:rhamnulokinase